MISFFADNLEMTVTNRKPQRHAIIFKMADIRVTVNGKQLSGPEVYWLEVDVENDVIEIRARQRQGAFYGAMTLLNLKNDQDLVIFMFCSYRFYVLTSSEPGFES